jgi:hypothetical protein
MMAGAANSGKYLRPWRAHSNSHQECLIILEQVGCPRIAWLCRDPRVYTPIEPSFPASSARASRSSIVCLALPDGRLKIRCLNPFLRSRLAKSSDGGKPITANSSESKHRPTRSQRRAVFPRPSARSFLFAGPANWHPAVAVIYDALKASLAPRSKKDLRTGLLDRLWPGPERFEVDELAVKLSNIPSPDLAHCQHPFAQDFSTLLV